MLSGSVKRPTNFEQDTFTAALERKARSWSSINVHLWAKFFRARAAIGEIVRDREHVADLVVRANASLVGTESGWVNPQVTCLRILLRVLAAVLGGDSSSSISAARQELVSYAQWSGLDANDRLAIEFMDQIESALTELQAEPETAMVSGLLPNALRTLGRISLLGEDVAAAIRPAVGGSALSLVLGQQRTWVYRTLESIEDEGDLRSLILRLLQATPPLYAQVRHGPLEYGKDIVAVLERDGDLVLEMYQAKVGDITMATWPKAREQLEEMFQVAMSHAQFDVQPDRREGILVFNGHLNPYVEPVVEDWLREQRRDHRRSYRLLHLDGIVTWVVGQRLVNELRDALRELEIPNVDSARGASAND